MDLSNTYGTIWILDLPVFSKVSHADTFAQINMDSKCADK
jgi:hypothetical protein